jgi:hypothetical protein
METRGTFPGSKQPERATEHSPTLVPILRMSGVVPLLPLYAVMACTGTALPLNAVFFPEVTFPIFTAFFKMMVVFWVFMRRDD